MSKIQHYLNNYKVYINLYSIKRGYIKINFDSRESLEKFALYFKRENKKHG